MKNKILKDHFLNPRNMGTIDNPSYQSIVKSDICNDIIKMMVVIDNNGLIADIKTEVFGCGYSISGASFFTEIAKGEKAEDILRISQKKIDSISNDIPEKHISCINLSQKAYHKIFEEYKPEN